MEIYVARPCLLKNEHTHHDPLATTPAMKGFMSTALAPMHRWLLQLFAGSATHVRQLGRPKLDGRNALRRAPKTVVITVVSASFPGLDEAASPQVGGSVVRVSYVFLGQLAAYLGV